MVNAAQLAKPGAARQPCDSSALVYVHVYALVCLITRSHEGSPVAETSERMVRKQILVPPATARRLEQLATARGLSVSEIIRQAVNAYDAKDGEAMGADELMELVSARLKDAITATRRARRTVSKALDVLDAEHT